MLVSVIRTSPYLHKNSPFGLIFKTVVWTDTIMRTMALFDATSCWDPDLQCRIGGEQPQFLDAILLETGDLNSLENV